MVDLAIMTLDNPFGSELFRFLRQLKRNNNRDWFQANKSRYERDVRDPMLRFIADFGPRLNRISTHFIADPRPIGGSLFRIHRDVRFSKDKSPYKIMAAAQFRHEDGKDVHAPGFYLHLEPASVFFGAGLWHPDNKTLAKIRDAIVENPTRWKRIISARTFRSNCTLGGDSLKKPPRGYDPDHPFVEDLKRKDFVTMTAFSEEDVCSTDFLNQFTSACRRTAPFVEFLTRAVGLPF
jgi:uncharacterized protein (TIGR02453 family)